MCNWQCLNIYKESAKPHMYSRRSLWFLWLLYSMAGMMSQCTPSDNIKGVFLTIKWTALIRPNRRERALTACGVDAVKCVYIMRRLGYGTEYFYLWPLAGISACGSCSQWETSHGETANATCCSSPSCELFINPFLTFITAASCCSSPSCDLLTLSSLSNSRHLLLLS